MHVANVKLPGHFLIELLSATLGVVTTSHRLLLVNS